MKRKTCQIELSELFGGWNLFKAAGIDEKELSFSLILGRERLYEMLLEAWDLSMDEYPLDDFGYRIITREACIHERLEYLPDYSFFITNTNGFVESFSDSDCKEV